LRKKYDKKRDASDSSSEILREESLVPLAMTAHAPSQAIHVPAIHVNDIVTGK
jgi:plasmid maintenance system antidote protein VapI